MSNDYQFDPTDYGFLPLPDSFRDYWGAAKRWYKVIATGGGNFWYVACTQPFGDDRWSFQKHSGAIGKELSGNPHILYVGCVTSDEFARLLLIHLFGSDTNEGTTQHGTSRLNEVSMPVL